jgi:hypothetical protein
MNRRRFLQMLSAGAFGAMTLDVEKLLWVPGQKTIFLPPPSSNSILTIEMITRESLRILENMLTFGTHAQRSYEGGHKLGDTVMGSAVLADHCAVDLAFPTAPTTLNAYSTRVLRPAISELAKRVNNVGPFVFGELDLPKGVHAAARVTSDKASLRGTVAYDMRSASMVLRLDALVGGS